MKRFNFIRLPQHISFTNEYCHGVYVPRCMQQCHTLMTITDENKDW